MAAPREVDVQAGLDVGKKKHFADVLDNDGERLFARAVANNQADPEALLDRAARPGTPGLAGQPGSARRRCDVILAMLRTGQPYRVNRPAPSLAGAA